MKFTVGVLILSDKCSTEHGLDKTTPAIEEFFEKYNKLEGVKTQYCIEQTKIVPDDAEQIKTVLTKWCQNDIGMNLVLTSGGTGFTDSDITPEVVKSLLHREAPGIVHRMLSESFKITPFAMMARPAAGTRHKSLIVTLPGSPKGAIENLEAVIPTLGHALSQIGNRDSRALHKKMERTLTNAPPGNGDVVSEVNLDMSQKNAYLHEHKKHHHHHHHHHESGSNQKVGCGISKHQLISNDLEQPVTARARSSPYPMVSMDDAFQMIQEQTDKPTEIEINVRSVNPLGYVIAEDIYSPINVPEFRASIVDGYAVKSSDGPGTYPVVSISHASPTESQHELSAGEIARVTTGAPIPLGADAIVMVEETKLVSYNSDATEEKEVLVLALNVKPHDNVRDVGSDIKKGDLIFAKGHIISSSGAENGILASVGISTIKVFKKPKIGVLSTGDELVDNLQNSAALQYGQIFDSNRPTLLSAVSNSNYEAVDLKIAADDKRSLEDVIRDSFESNNIDYLITTGGVSMGELDLLKPIIERKLNGTIHFGRVKMKPGKPTTFATFQSQETKKTIFALPGNPASAAVCFYLFVLPSLRLFSGYSISTSDSKLPSLPILKAKLEDDVTLDLRPEYQRVITHQNENFELVAKNTGFQRSSRIASFRNANSLVVLPSKDDYGETKIRAGSLVDVMMFGPIGGYH